ncbi:hypothetical protein BU26DRAFT_506677 [Trematosphaeria pertusa]|uniref:F-box domain-containing protein n=1 Tax=Trematosphaeria pertusa TaxID=390896 RepID=A0A6A6IBK2_9PLEO|nr:uncharacterized protein BU26DRAFT_506677 [Trematosphaeria pertusa]KAF2247438.1 hypothetical protein BU26DRAFT_506677 [Trematosphaeria pertusa]
MSLANEPFPESPAQMSLKHCMPSLPDLLSNRFIPIQDAVLSALSPQDLARLSGVCRDLHSVVQGARNWDSWLQTWFSNPKDFRSLQGKLNAIITGNPLIDFIARTQHFINSDPTLNVIIPGPDRKAMMRYLISDGYEAPCEKAPSGCDDFAFDECIRLVHPTRTVNGANKASILVVRAEPYHSPIHLPLDKSCGTTIQQNYATWNKVYSLFPSSTFIDKEGYLMVELSERVGPTLYQLSKGGYKAKDIHWFEKNYKAPGMTSEMLTRSRRIGDQHTLVIRLSTADVSKPAVPDGALESTTFYLFKEVRNGISFYDVNCNIKICHPVLRYVYELLYDETDNEYNKSIRHLQVRLDNLARMELYKIPVEQRPAGYQSLVLNRNVSCTEWHFNKPDSWTYYDDDVIEYLAKIWRDREQKELEMKELEATQKGAKKRLLHR